MYQVVSSWAWLERLAQELHSCFSKGLASLAMVATAAGTDDILPGVRTATGTRYDVVDGQIMGTDTAVLAGVVVAEEDLATTEFDTHRGALDQAQEPDDRRCGEAPLCRSNLLLIGLQDFCLAGKPQNKRSPQCCHMEWLVVLVQNEDWSVTVEGYKTIALGRELQGDVTVVALERISVKHGIDPITGPCRA